MTNNVADAPASSYESLYSKKIDSLMIGEDYSVRLGALSSPPNFLVLEEAEMGNRTHSRGTASFEKAVKILKDKVRKKGNLGYVTVERQLELIDQLCEFPFGRYLVERKGANGFWTDYLISYRTGIDQKPSSLIEDFILNRSLIVLAHRERFETYQRLMQKLMKDRIVLASIPCGLMRDLLTLEFSKAPLFKLVGLDIDKESLIIAADFAEKLGIKNVELLQQDAWRMKFREAFDVITSSGLNVYEPDPKKVLELYQRFYDALKPGGSLIISVLTYPPRESRETDWDLTGVAAEDVEMERILYHDILDLHWRNFRSAEELDKEFKEVGFSKVTVYFDKHRIFPTIHAEK